MVVELVVDTPKGLQQAMLDDGFRSDRKGLSEYLYGLGWSVTKVKNVFTEIKDALK